jgi:hypothetical protein
VQKYFWQPYGCSKLVMKAVKTATQILKEDTRGDFT